MTGNSIGVRRDIRWRIAMWGGAALLLLAPAIAMQVTREVAWDATDFATFGGMLVVACGAFEIAARITSRTAYRVAAGLAIAAAFLLVWAELAVGLFH